VRAIKRQRNGAHIGKMTGLNYKRGGMGGELKISTLTGGGKHKNVTIQSSSIMEECHGRAGGKKEKRYGKGSSP